MINSVTKAKYKVTIGIECHVQLKTKSKLFSAANNDAREAPPNTLVNHIDFGLPGALPVLNREALNLAVKAAFALNSEPQRFSKFDRKHYFYPDLPMGYQITQFDEPIILGGSIDINVNGDVKTIGITRAHLEADAGKSVHPSGADYSLVDFNRAGTPLLEIVSEPDMHSALDAKAYAHELYLRMRYADVSEANLYYGNMRFDVNVSVSKTGLLGTRTETKNINSFKSIEKVVEYEFDRQIEVLESGNSVAQETRGWDDDTQKTISQRTKENADDYRYMPDPDIPPVVLEDNFISNVKDNMLALPPYYRSQFAQMDIDFNAIEDILASPDTARLVERVLSSSGPVHARRIAFWTMQPADETNDQANQPINVSEVNLIKLSELVSANKLSSSAAKVVYGEMLKNDRAPEEIAETKNLLQVSDKLEIAAIVKDVLDQNAKAANDVKNGETKAIGFLVGQVMKLSRGKANPQMAQDLIKQQLELTS